MIQDIEIEFRFADGTSTTETFAPENGPISGDIEEFADDYCEENDTELEGWDIVDYDFDYANPDDFGSIDYYCEYAAKVNEHGEAYALRYEDVGEHNFNVDYNGCWDSEEEFTRQLFEDCYDIPSSLERYIDWEIVARDFMCDYSAYIGGEGVHIFRNC